MRTKRCMAFLLALMMLLGETTGAWAAETNESLYGDSVIESVFDDTANTYEVMDVTSNIPSFDEEATVSDNDEEKIADEADTDEIIEEPEESNVPENNDSYTDGDLFDISANDPEGVQFWDDEGSFTAYMEAGKAYTVYIREDDSEYNEYAELSIGLPDSDTSSHYGESFYYEPADTGIYNIEYSLNYNYYGMRLVVMETSKIKSVKVSGGTKEIYDDIANTDFTDDLSFELEFENGEKKTADFSMLGWDYQKEIALFDGNGNRIYEPHFGTNTAEIRYYVGGNHFASRKVSVKKADWTNAPIIKTGDKINISSTKQNIYKLKVKEDPRTPGYSFRYRFEFLNWPLYSIQMVTLSDGVMSASSVDNNYVDGDMSNATKDGYFYITIDSNRDVSATVLDNSFYLEKFEIVSAPTGIMDICVDRDIDTSKINVKGTWGNGTEKICSFADFRDILNRNSDWIYIDYVDEDGTSVENADKLQLGEKYYYYAYTESGLEATYEASPVVFAAPKVTGNIVVDREKTISGSTTGKPVILAAKLEQGKRYLFKETNIKDFSAFDSDYDSWYGGASWNDGESVKYNICHVEKSGTYYFYVYPNKTDGKIQLTELKNLKKVTVDYSDMQDVYYYDPIVYHKYNGFLDYPDLEKIVYTLTFTDGTVEKVAYDALLTHIYGVYAYVSNYNGSLSIKGSYEKSYFDEERGEFKYDYIRFEKELTVKSVDEIPVLREGESVEVEADNNPSYVRLYVEKGLSYTISYNAPVVYSIDETGNDYSGEAAYSCKFTPKFSGYYYLKIETECDTTVTLERTKTAKSFDVSFNSDDFKCAYGDGFNPYGVDIVLLYADGESEVVEGNETEYAINGISYALKTADGKTASKDALGNYPVGSYNLVYSVKGLTGTKKVPVIISGVRADYTIVYNSNGGTGSMKSQAAGKNKVVTLKTNAFKRAGYEFVGWSITPKLPLEFEAAPDAIDESRDYTDKEKVINLSSEGGKITLYAVWKVKKYTITYVLSGGRFTEDADVVYSFDVSGSDEIVLPTAEDMEEEIGYTFEGWYTSNSYKASEKTEVIKAGSTRDKIFYAKWSPKTYKITFAGNGATSGNTKAQTASYGTWTKLNKNGFVKTDGTVKYGMIYWTVSGNESDEVYENQSSIWISEEPDCVKISQGDKVTILPKSTEEITLVANWQDTFTITLVGWDGSEREFTHKYGVEDKLSKKVTPIAHVGYTFGGWYLDEGLTKKITEIKKDVVSGFRIYERWTENTYTLKIDSNGGSGKSVSKKLTYSQIAQIPANTYKKSGYTFAGWTTYANRNKVKALANKAAFDAIKDSIDYYEDAETIESLVTKNKGSITLYAIWYRANYILTLDYMDDNQADVEFEYLYSPLSSAKDVSSGDKIDSTPEFKSPKREGYAFGGWYKGLNFKTKVTTTKGLQENVTLYAKWVKENIIVYDDGTGNVLSDKVTYGKNYKIKAVANREKEALVGWWTYQWGERVYFDPEQTIVLYAPTGEFETEVLHAIWQSEFDINYENIDDEEIYGMEDAPTGYDFGEVTLIPSPYREGYSFEGWYTDSKFKTKIDVISDTMASDVVLYAKWKGLAYTITFNANAPEGSKASGKVKSQKMTVGTDKAITKNAFKVAGYSFAGWALSPDGPIAYGNGEIVDSIGESFNKNVTLYAVWEENVYTVTYVVNVSGEVLGLLEDNADTYTYFTGYELETPSRIGYTFLGWYTDKNLKKKASNLKKGTTGNKTFYAKWKAN